MKNESLGCEVSPSRWLLDFLEKGKRGRTIGLWNVITGTLVMAKRVRTASELVWLLEASVRLRGFPVGNRMLQRWNLRVCHSGLGSTP